MSKPELLPCPFCGQKVGEPFENYDDWYVNCNACDIGFHSNVPQSVIRQWNTRSYPYHPEVLPIIRAFVERVEKRGCWNGECVMRDELAALEKEAE